jgi:hypothetical protein
MPLTPASWAGDVPGTARTAKIETVSSAVLPRLHPKAKFETGCAHFIDRDLVTTCSLNGRWNNPQGPAGVPWLVPLLVPLAQTSPSYRLALVKPG